MHGDYVAGGWNPLLPHGRHLHPRHLPQRPLAPTRRDWKGPRLEAPWACVTRTQESPGEARPCRDHQHQHQRRSSFHLWQHRHCSLFHCHCNNWEGSWWQHQRSSQWKGSCCFRSQLRCFFFFFPLQTFGHLPCVHMDGIHVFAKAVSDFGNSVDTLGFGKHFTGCSRREREREGRVHAWWYLNERSYKWMLSGCLLKLYCSVESCLICFWFSYDQSKIWYLFWVQLWPVKTLISVLGSVTTSPKSGICFGFSYDQSKIWYLFWVQLLPVQNLLYVFGSVTTSPKSGICFGFSYNQSKIWYLFWVQLGPVQNLISVLGSVTTSPKTDNLFWVQLRPVKNLISALGSVRTSRISAEEQSTFAKYLYTENRTERRGFLFFLFCFVFQQSRS